MYKVKGLRKYISLADFISSNIVGQALGAATAINGTFFCEWVMKVS
jgi:hypothetical protein